MRPTVTFLGDETIDRILDQAFRVLETLGVEINNPKVLSLLSDHGARIDKEHSRAFLPPVLVRQAIDDAPEGFCLYDVRGNQTHDFSGHKVHFTPGSAALNVLDHETQKMRRPVTRDYIEHVKVVSRLDHIAAQSTALIPTDVPEGMSDSYRLFLSLLYCEKPVVTGAFSIESFEVMKDMQVIVRETEEALREKPLTIFSCCPTSPLKWSAVTSQNLVDCARNSIPVEFIAMPLSGFMAPVTLFGTLVQHTAETLSGVVISQLVNPGTPILYGGSPAIFDVRYETTPMGAVETMMIDCAYNEIGKRLGLPTQAYISMSDAKRLDAQAGLESGMGATLGALAGINSISGPGMIDFESCQSLEKLVLDNEIAGMTFRMAAGINADEGASSVGLFMELLEEKHLLASEHTLERLRDEITFPGPVIDRANRERWIQDGGVTLGDRAHRCVEEYLKSYEPSSLSGDKKRKITERMESEARRHGMEELKIER